MAEERTSGIVQAINDIANTIHQQSLQIDNIRRKLDEQEITLYDHGALLRQHSRDSISIKAQLNAMDGKLDEVLALLKKEQ